MSYKTDNIRNLVLLGHAGSGKTSLAECMLYEAGQIDRIGGVNDENTVSDSTHIEREKKSSIFASLMYAPWKDSKINIIDTPGLDDFVGEVVSALKVADTGLVVLNAASGVEVGTELVWERIIKHQLPSIFVINQLDREKADFQHTLQQAKDRFGNKVLEIQYPINSGEGFNTIVDCLRMVVYKFSDNGGKPTKETIPESEMERAKAIHNILVETAAENDDGLMEKYFDEGQLTEEELAKGLSIGLAKQLFFPVFCCSAATNMGSGRIMGFVNDIAPSPKERAEYGEAENTYDHQTSTEAFIYKSISEPQVGLVSYMKIYAGSLETGAELYNNDTQSTERINQLYLANGKSRKSIDKVYAGDLCVTVKLKDSYTNQSLVQKGQKSTVVKIDFPHARIRGAVRSMGKGEMEKVMKVLNQLSVEDPTLSIEQSKSLKQTILHGQGELHLDLIRYRIEKVNNIKIDFDKPNIPYRETITALAEASYRHKKQSGGSGQFAEVHLRVEPYQEGMGNPEGLTLRSEEVIDLDWGGKFSFCWCIVGGSIDSKYSNAIKKGILQQLEEGPLTGSHCQDIRVSVYDGKMHSVDSNDMAFMIAASTAFKEAFKNAKPQILEPMYKLEVLCSDTVLGDVMSDLQSRRAMIVGMESEGHYQKVIANVPLAELYKYSSSLRAITQGRAKFSKALEEYASVSHDIQKNLIKTYAEEDD